MYSDKKRTTRLLLLFLILVGVGGMFYYRDILDAAALQRWVDNVGAAGPLLFVLIYIIATIVFFPGSLLTLTGGVLFGPLLGTLYNILGATIGAGLAFLAARYLGASWVEKHLADSGGRVQKLIEGVEQEGWRFVVFVRLVPLFPFNILNYVLGLTKIKFSHYIIASAVGMVPGTIAYTYLGYATKEAVAGKGDIQFIIQLSLIATALLTMVAYLPRIIKRLRA